MGRPRNVSSLGSSVRFYGVSEICKLGLERFWTGPKWMGTYPLFQSNNPSLILLCALRLQHRTEVANWQPVAESDVFCPSLLYLHYLPGPPRFLSFQPLVFAVTKTVLQINDTERESALWVEWGRAQLSGWRGAEWELYLGFCTWLLGWALGGKFCVCILVTLTALLWIFVLDSVTS